MAYTADEVFRTAREAADGHADRTKVFQMLEDHARALMARSPKDYAIEFAGYMAKEAEDLLTANNVLSGALVAFDECDGSNKTAAEDRLEAAHFMVGECMAALRVAIYEFRKRKASAYPHTAKHAAEGQHDQDAGKQPETGTAKALADGFADDGKDETGQRDQGNERHGSTPTGQLHLKCQNVTPP